VPGTGYSVTSVIPAQARIQSIFRYGVIPAQAGIQSNFRYGVIPAQAGIR
jgi:hypothetical protein